MSAFDRLVLAERGHYWFEPRNRLLTGLARAHFPKAQHYLEIGCGTGFVLDAFSRLRDWSSFTGSELHPGGLIHARRRLGGRAQFVQMDARHIPALGAFDLVGAYDVLEHIQEDDTAMSAVYASLAADGGFIVAVPQHPWLWSSSDDRGRHVRRYRLGELEGKLKTAGFRILRSTSYTSLLLPLMAARRILRRKVGHEAVNAELAVSKTVNRLLRSVSNAEVSLSLLGVPWLLGGSRVVVAQK